MRVDDSVVVIALMTVQVPILRGTLVRNVVLLGMVTA